MFYPPVGNIDLEALSGICGSISIACWVVVFSPQIIENFRRGSAEGLSLLFLVVWLAGDVFNILGAVLQGVLPTMTILAVYYTLADIVLLGQCFYYRGFTLKDELSPPASRAQESDAEDQSLVPGKVSERTALLAVETNGQPHAQEPTGNGFPTSGQSSQQSYPHRQNHRRHSAASFKDILHPSVDGTHLSPVTPFVEPSAKETRPARRLSALQNILLNLSVIVLVCAAGVLGWYVSPGSSKGEGHQGDSNPFSFDVLGQVFGYLCAALYLGSRLPQILLNYRRKSTDGVSLLFFLFACIGNLTYVLSILAYSPVCKGEFAQGRVGQCRPGEAATLYGQYILVNLSWLIGSLGTLFLDMVIFVQFFLYQNNGFGETEGTSEETLRG
ncbi:PQ loop repeat-domain-containing protein [Aspergillus coremiiformis]|uniref:PQ loop repeat-domain-containing protein n=1 Tax=Aspergillus coremiiformis TaxID=138285 RepID=A0A5N6Z2X4_9EURO|nr:PQ loop repeat-domain-containing protein [Aspergillus coremiiformis]